MLIKPIAQFKKTKSNRSLLGKPSGGKSGGKKGLLFPTFPKKLSPPEPKNKSASTRKGLCIDSGSENSIVEENFEDGTPKIKVTELLEPKTTSQLEKKRPNPFVNLGMCDSDSEISSDTPSKSMKLGIIRLEKEPKSAWVIKPEFPRTIKHASECTAMIKEAEESSKVFPTIVLTQLGEDSKF